MERHQHNAHQQILFSTLNRMQTLGDRRLFDELLHRMLYDDGGSPNSPIPNDTSGWFPDGSGQVVHVSGDRSTGVTFNIQAGLGFKKFATGQPDDENPSFQPIFIGADQAFVTNNSDPGNNRIDRVYCKPKLTDANSTSVNIIDPNPPNNITSEARFIDKDYDFDWAYAAGTPAASPTPPTAPVGFVDADAVAEILIRAGSGAFNPADITDLRTLFNLSDNLVPAITSFPANQVTVSPTVLGESDAQAALQALETGVAANVPSGLLTGFLQYVQTNQVRLRAGVGGKIRCEIDGVVLEQATDIIFELGDSGVGASDLDTGLEAASTPYYLYLQNVGGILTEHLSATAPVLEGVKAGYHPTNTTWRCVGAFWNDASSNIVPFQMVGRYQRFLFVDSDHEWNTTTLTTTIPKAWAVLNPNVPVGTSEVTIQSLIRVNNLAVVFGRGTTTTTLGAGTYTGMLAANQEEIVFGNFNSYNASVQNPNMSQSNTGVVPIDNRAVPRISYGHMRFVGTGSDFFLNEARVLGFEYPFAPEGK